MRSIIYLFLAVSFFTFYGLHVGLKAKEPIQTDLELMQGTWIIESMIINGKELAAEDLKDWRRIVKGNRVTWKKGEEILLETEIKIDPSKTPMRLDSKIIVGEGMGQVSLAIYEIRDEKLRVCFANPDKSRPTMFISEADNGQSLFVAKRLKSGIR